MLSEWILIISILKCIDSRFRGNDSRANGNETVRRTGMTMLLSTLMPKGLEGIVLEEV
jgi:hypothetical protein